MIYNCACTPCFNIIETVFCDMKFYIRSRNKNTARELIEEARFFLNNNINSEYMFKKIVASCKFFLKALNYIEF